MVLLTGYDRQQLARARDCTQSMARDVHVHSRYFTPLQKQGAHHTTIRVRGTFGVKSGAADVLIVR